MAISTTPAIDTALADLPQAERFYWRVKTSNLVPLGIWPGDELKLEMPFQLQDGSWLLLSFNDRFYLRQLSIQEDHFLLTPLVGNQQPMAWPKHQPMPLVGRVMAIHRQIAAE